MGGQTPLQQHVSPRTPVHRIARRTVKFWHRPPRRMVVVSQLPAALRRSPGWPCCGRRLTRRVAHRASWDDSQTPGTGASSRRKGQSLASRDMHGMILDDVAGGHPQSPGRAVAARESRTLLKTFRDGGRAGLSSGLIRRGSRASAEDRTRPQLQVTDRADLPRTHVHRLGKRVECKPSRVRISHPPPR